MPVTVYTRVASLQGEEEEDLKGWQGQLGPDSLEALPVCWFRSPSIMHLVQSLQAIKVLSQQV